MNSLKRLKLTTQLNKVGSERQFRERYVGKREREREKTKNKYTVR